MIIYASDPVNGHFHANCEEFDTPQLRRIVGGRLAATMELFARKNAQYGENEFDLGAAGQFPEIHRKVRQLRRIIWEQADGAEEFDDARGLIMDLIGHLLMLLDCLGQESEDGVNKYPANFRGRHTYLVVDDEGRAWAGGHSIRVAKPHEERCRTVAGDIDSPGVGERQCIGVEGHEEEYHINKELEQWT